MIPRTMARALPGHPSCSGDQRLQRDEKAACGLVSKGNKRGLRLRPGAATRSCSRKHRGSVGKRVAMAMIDHRPARSAPTRSISTPYDQILTISEGPTTARHRPRSNTKHRDTEHATAASLVTSLRSAASSRRPVELYEDTYCSRTRRSMAGKPHQGLPTRFVCQSHERACLDHKLNQLPPAPCPPSPMSSSTVVLDASP